MSVALAEETRAEINWPRFPFPGLRPFRITPEADESQIFYGRNGHKDEILQRLNSSQLVSVVGPSGCGKSSLVKVGVIPVLKAGLLTRAGYDWIAIQMRPGTNAIGRLALAFASIEGDCSAGGTTSPDQIRQLLATERSALWLLMEHLAPALAREAVSKKARRVLLLVDQFEEIFSGVQDSRAVDQFVGLVAQFFRKPHPQLYLVLTMRTDFISQCATFPGLAEILNETQYITPVLRGEDLREAIVRPIYAYGGKIEPALVSEILKDMGAGATYDADHLPLMQHALLWLWVRSWRAIGIENPPTPATPWPKERKRACLSLAAYRENGCLAGILERHASDIFAHRIASGPEGQRYAHIAEVMFRRLSERDTSGRYKRAPATMSEVGRLAGCSREELDCVAVPYGEIEASFVERRLGRSPDDPLLDISHESLIRQWSQLRAWADDEGDRANYFRQLATEANEWKHERDKAGEGSRKARGLLKTGWNLERLQEWWTTQKPSAEWAKRYRLNPEGAATIADSLPVTTEFLAASQRARRRARFLFALPIALLFLGVVAGAAGVGWRDSLRAQEQEARLIATRGQIELHGQSQALAAYVAMELLGPANGYRKVPEAYRLAVDSLRRLHERYEIPVDRSFPSAEYSPDGTLLLTVDKDQLVLVDTNTGSLSHVPVHGIGDIRAARWAPGQGEIFVMTSDRSTFLIPVADLSHARESISAGSPIRLGQEADRLGWGLFSGDGKVIATNGSGGLVKVWDTETGAEKTSVPTIESPGWLPFALNRDGTRIAIAPKSDSVRIYDIIGGNVPPRTVSLLSSGRSSTQQKDSEPDGAGPIVSVAFNPSDPKSDTLLVARGDHAEVWDISQRRPLFTVRPPPKSRQDGRIAQAVYSPDGNKIAASYEDGAIRIWWAATQDQLATLREHQGRVMTIGFSPDGNHLASAGQDRTVRIWNVTAALTSDAPPEGETWAQFIQDRLPTGDGHSIDLKRRACSLAILPADHCDVSKDEDD